MSLNTGYFPPHARRRKQPNTSYHQALSLRSARSSLESTYGNESFLPPISTTIVSNGGHRPYRRNDFANNHLFLAKRKLAGIFLGQSTKSLQSTSDLTHLFDQPKQRKQHPFKHKQQDSLTNKTSSTENDAHLSVVNLVIKPPYPSSQTRDPLSTILSRHRSQIYSSKIRRPSIDTTNSTAKQNFPSTSLQTFTDNSELDDLIVNDHFSDAMNTSLYPFDSSILCVKSIIPSVGPQHPNHH